MSRFTCQLGDGLDLVLREPSTVRPMHELIVANLDRLRAWEPWAHGEQTVEALRSFTIFQLQEWVQGRNLPTALRIEGQLIGAVGARIDPYAGTAELGYWIDAGHEGRGAVSRGVRAVIDQLFADYDTRRVEIRTSITNHRSRALADRLGFVHEGTLHSALPVGADRHDIAVYGLLKDSRRPDAGASSTPA